MRYDYPIEQRDFIFLLNCIMEEFTVATLNHFKDSGYRFVLYYNMEHFAVLVPLYKEEEMIGGSYLIPIDEEQVLEMAQGVDGFCFYVLK